MKIVALVPYWSNYTYEDNSIDGRDTMLLSGKSLLNYPLLLANKIKDIDSTYIFTNDNSVESTIQDHLKFELLHRDQNLDSQNATIEDIVSSFLNVIDCDFVLLLHPSSPFLQPETISDCISKVVSGNFDSAFIARREKKFAWFRLERLNYDTSKGTPHLSNVEPIILESTAAYFFSRNSFNRFKTRIGQKPYVKEVGPFEGMVVSSKEELKISEFLLDSGFFVDSKQ